MKFEALRLSGFKSFVEPLEIAIRPGLTGIVGPNGCGKSNLLEALRWSMGESSPRSLRAGSEAGGGGMDDVIFAGTAKRPARHVAEVTLVLDNSARTAPAAFNSEDRLEVSRRIERGQGSDYRINGRDVRQRDVQLLFADAATGAHSPALVSQGRVAAIIAARPEERRQLLEDAAGIGGLAVRRREAEIRLRAADANLARLADLMTAAEAQVAALRRQARLALRYRELSARIRESEAASLRLALHEATTRLQAARARAALGEAALAEAVEAEAVARTAQANAAAGIPALRQAEAEAAARMQAMMTARATLVAERAAAIQRLADLRAALQAAGADRDRARARLADSAATRTRLQAERDAAVRALAEAEAAAGPSAVAVAEAEQAATTVERALATAVETHAAIVAEGRSIRAAAEAAEARWKRLTAERDRQAAELLRLDGAGGADRALADVHEAEARLAVCAEAAEPANGRVGAAEAARRAAEEARALVASALAQAGAELKGLEAEAEALRRLQVHPDRKGAPSATLSADPGYEAALAAALGDEASAPVGPPADKERPGRRWWGVAVQPADPSLPPGLAPLALHVAAPPELARRLAQVAVVDQPPDPALLSSLAPGQRLVSREGWMWRWDGFVAPPGGAAGAVAERMRQANRMRELEEEMAGPRERAASAEAELERQKAAVGAAEAEERLALGARTEAIRQRDQARARLEGLRNVAAQAEARRAAVSASVERLSAECESAEQEAAAAAARVSGLPDSSAAAGMVGEARSAAERARAELARLRAELAGCKRSAEDGRARSAALTREIEAWDARDREAEAAVRLLDQRIEAITADEIALLGEPEALADRLAALEADLAAADAARAQAADAVLAAELSLADLDRAARQRASEVADRREARATTQAALEAAAERQAAVEAEAIETLGALPDAGEPTDALRQAAGELERLRAERERLGPVNLVAEAELAEAEADLARKGAERAELETAIARLRGSIGALNREGRARLLSAFHDVDRHFRDLFLTLFGGGSAELALVDSEDPLEAGLEIRAQPPGKRLQSLSLLSGGEQALTALALIFALFRTRPAPICVLDEVDAPLDDANVERFCRLLEHMTGTTDTRFLVVTHNLISMGAMHRLYGVTMAEAGVSQLVSVDLAVAERLAAA